MRNFFWILILIFVSISTNISLANSVTNYKTEFFNPDNINFESTIFQLDQDTAQVSLSKAAPSIITACVNTSVTLTNTALPNNGHGCSNVANYVWNFGDGTTAVSTQLTSPQSKTHIYSQPGLYTVTLTSQNGCGAITNTLQICVEPPPVPTFTLDNNQGCAPLIVQTTNTTNTTTICSAINYTWDVTYDPGDCGTTGSYSFTNGSNSSSVNPTFQFTTPGIYTIKLSVTNFCGTYFSTQTVVVKRPPIVSVDNIPDFCGTATLNPTATVKSCSQLNALSYSWSFPGGSPSFSTNANPVNIYYSTPGQYTVLLNVTNECGVSVTDTKTFTIKKAPKVTTNPLNQTVCSGMPTSQVDLTADMPGTTFSWTATATLGVSGFNASGTTDFLPVQTLTTTGTTAGTVTYAITPSSSGCTGPTVNYIVTVNPAPIFTLQPVPSNVCLNGTPNNLTVAISPIADTPLYQWYSFTGANPAAAIPGATGSTYTPSTNTIGSTNYYCIVTFSSGACANLVSNTVTVTVATPPVINSQPPLLQNICVGGTVGTPLSVGYIGGTGSASYRWYVNAINSNVGGTAIVGATSSTFIPASFVSVGQYYYYVIVTLSGNNCGSIISNTAEVNVLADPTVSSQPILTQTICQGSTPVTISVNAIGGIGSFIYQWYQNTVNSNSGGILIPGATNNSYTPSTTTVGTSYYYCLITQTGLNCDVTSNTSQVIVNASPTFATQPLPSSVCIGGTPNQLSVSTINGVGVPTYQWYRNTVNDNSTGTSIVGANGTTYNPSGASLGTTYYYCVATFALGGCNVITSNAAAVAVNSLPTISSQPTPIQTICIGGTIGLPLSVNYAGGAGTASYQWYSNGVNLNTGGTAIVGATSSTYTPPSFVAVWNYYYYVEVTLSGNNCGSVTSNPAQINVVADPTVSTQPLSTQTICQNSVPSDLLVSAIGGLGAFTYQWYQNTVNNNTTGVLIGGATSNTYTPPTTIAGTSYYYCVISQTGLNCGVTTNTSQVIVVSQPTVVNQPLSSTICVGGAPVQLAVSTINGIGVPTYQWFSNTVDDNTTGTLIAGAVGITYNPSGAVAGTVYYYCKITFSAGCNTITSNTATVTVVPSPSISIHPTPTQEICAGNTIGSALSVSYINGVGTPTYQWYSNTVNSNAGGTAIAGATSSTYTPTPFSVSGSYYYYVEVTLSGNGCVPAVSNAAEIVVDPNPVVSPQSVPTQSVCINTTPQTLSVTASGGLGTYTYQWYENTVNNSTTGSIISGETNNTYIPLTTAIGTKYYYCEIKNSTGVNCSVISAVATVIVNPEPTFTSQPASATICAGTTVTPLSVTYKDGAGIPSYQWFSNTTNDNTSGTLIALATNSTYSPSTVAVGTLYYYCIVTLAPGGCSVLVSNTAQITVDPIPVISTFNTEICNGTAFSVTPQDVTNGIVPAGTTYTWSMPAISPAGAVTGASSQSIAQSTISQTLTNTTTSAATVTYVVTPLSGACPGSNFNIVVTVDPTIVPTVSVQNISCFGVVDGALSATVTGGVPPYSFAWTGPNGFTAGVAAISGLHPGDYSLAVTDSKGCQVTNTYTVTEPAEIKITTDIQTDETFFGADNAIIHITISGGTPPYSYSWTKDGVAYATTEDLDNVPPGSYEVAVSDAHSCGPKYNFYDVTVPPELVVSLISKTDINCFGDTNGTISVDVVGGTPIQITPGVFGYLYSWTGPNGFTSKAKDLTNLAAGTYILNVTDNSGFSKQLTVNLTQSSAIDIALSTAPKLDCAAKVVSEVTTATVSGGNPPYKLVWSRGTVSGSNNEVMESSQAGSVNLQVTDAIGCVVDSTFNVAIAPIGIDYKVLDCDKHLYQFDAIVLDPLGTYTYLWNFGDGVTDTNKTVDHSFATAGNKTVQLTISSSACSIGFTQQVTVEGPPVLTLDKDPKVCIGDSTVIHVSGADTYRWDDNSVADSIMLNRTGEYSVTGTSKSGCTAVLKFMVSNFDLFKYTIQSDKNQISTMNSTVRFWSESIPSTEYSWDFGDGKSGQGNNLDHIYNITTEKSFDVKLKVTNPNGCVENATKRILVVNSSMYNTFSPNGDGIDDVFMKTWHIKVYNRNGILIHDGFDGWDGTYNGKPVSNDTYFFVVFYTTESGAKTNSGYVTVVR